jgi:hypothetical protein
MGDTALTLKYMMNFNADRTNPNFALQEGLLNIEGEAIDTSVNTNKWQVPQQDLDFFVSTLSTAMMRVDHAESALAVIGRITKAVRDDSRVLFRAEVGDRAVIEKILRGYLQHVSAQVDSDDVECSSCGRQTRKEGQLIHLCPDAWEIVHKPRVRELSIVASPAYKTTTFGPMGFYNAMNASQRCRSDDPLTEEQKAGILARLTLLNAQVSMINFNASLKNEKKTLSRMSARCGRVLANLEAIEAIAKAAKAKSRRELQRPRTPVEELANAAGLRVQRVLR